MTDQPDPYAQAMALHERGEFAPAEAAYRAILAGHPGHVDALHMLGVLLVQTGRSADGIASIRQAIELRPDLVDAHFNCGIALMQTRQIEAALESFTEAARLAPAHFGARYNRAHILMQLGRIDQSLVEYEALRTLAPNNVDVLVNTAIALGCLNRMQDALALYNRAIELQPQSRAALEGRGIVLLSLGRAGEALQSFDRALALVPDDAPLLASRGEALKALCRYEEALEALTRSAALNGGVYTTWVNRGAILRLLARPSEALESQDRALAIRPNGVEALTARSAALEDLMRLDEAEASLDAALAIDPDYPLARCNRGQLLLLRGRFAEGWLGYESRKALRPGNKAYTIGPVWDGRAPLAGKTLFVRWEQGFGDTIQFCRYASLAASRGAVVVLCVQDGLLELLDKFDPRVKVIGERSPAPPFDYYAPLLSLPGAFATTLDTIPPARPLEPQAGKVRSWAGRLGKRTKKRVGLVWSGRAEHEDDRNRSIPLLTLSPLFAVGAELVSLQKEVRERDRPALAAAPIRQFPLTDFADTAGLISHLDLVISVDTSVAHLAAAMGKPTWILLPFAPDWRWLLDREDTPWYPSARLFRQSAARDWNEVIGRVREAFGREPG